MSDGLVLWRRFQGTIWDRTNVAVRGPREDWLLAFDIVWGQLDAPSRADLRTKITYFYDRSREFRTAGEIWVLSRSFRGGPEDFDAFGYELVGRPSFAAFAAAAWGVEAARQARGEAARTLIAALPQGCGAQQLAVFLEQEDIHYARIHPRIMLPRFEEHARLKLADRKRHAYGMLGEKWVGGWPIGNGSFGKTVLWVKQDARRRIIDRVVIKDSYFREDRTKNWWTNPEAWKVVNGRSVPAEIQALLELRNKVGSDSIVELRNWRVGDRMHRQYLEFCQFKDLFAYRNKNLPEPFLWWCFDRLATAALLMERGQLGSPDPLKSEPLPGWDWIIHRDMKLSNVFIGFNHTDEFTRYPQPKLGDFGFALFTSRNDTRVNISNPGTLGNRPPEQAKAIMDGRGGYMPLTPKSNIWGVGIIMYGLLKGCEQPSNHEKCYQSGQPAPPIRVESDYSLPHVSLAMKRMITQCLSELPKDRPSAHDLLRGIRTWTNPPEPNEAKGMRSSNDAREWRPYHFPWPTADPNRWALAYPVPHLPNGAQPPRPPAREVAREESLGGLAGGYMLDEGATPADPGVKVEQQEGPGALIW